jgi:hypothetical protein
VAERHFDSDLVLGRFLDAELSGTSDT